MKRILLLALLASPLHAAEDDCERDVYVEALFSAYAQMIIGLEETKDPVRVEQYMRAIGLIQDKVRTLRDSRLAVREKPICDPWLD